MIELLTAVRDRDRVSYDDADIRAKASEVYELADGNGLLAVSIRDLDVSFVVFAFESGPATDCTGAIVDGAKWQHVFNGSGPSDPLRELRHTYWGDPDNSGYIFYPSAKLITAAFDKLKTWFDCEI